MWLATVVASVRRTTRGREAAGQCVAVVDTRWRRYRCDIAATASTTGAATSSAAPAPRESTSTGADETHRPPSECQCIVAGPNTRSIIADELAFFQSRPNVRFLSRCD